jgi:hypothetical protein
MINYLFRGIALAIGLWVAADALLPAIERPAQVASRSSLSAGQREVRFTGAKTTTCEVDILAYNAMDEGDMVLLDTSRTFGRCTYVEKNGVALYRRSNWRIWEGLIALFLFVIAFGGASYNPDRFSSDDWNVDFSDD